MPENLYQLCCCLVGQHNHVFRYRRTDWPRFWRAVTRHRCIRCGSNV
jgi:hypothetical protein